MKSKHIVDLAGPEGNAHFLINLARLLAMHYGKDGNEICKRMMAGDYDSLLDVLVAELGTHVLLVNRPSRKGTKQ